ncbi:aldose 1-epimerase [Alicyclobacillus tolerans]|uniref:aldose 1-epimerase n=1 Tax=Alicyclobacillus tolerans TaxID=90970 RepID=UPI001F167DCA|nr:aldose 1-epimerase [Alicyclobacillus tolerans]MCF8567836.1 aldose 1-epimerase [Alicyclobacillus tolerans]
MRYEVSSEMCGEHQIVILKDYVTNTVAKVLPGLGNNLFSLSFNARPIIQAPPTIRALEEHPTHYGVPILFPPNRVRNARFRFKGREYRFAPNFGPHYIHGEICSKPWHVVNGSADPHNGAFITSQFRFKEDSELMAQFPHDLVLEMTYRVYNGKLEAFVTASNHGDTAAPFALGFHPYFHVTPDSQVVIPADQEWSLDSEGFIDSPPQNTEFCHELFKGLPVVHIPQRLGYRLISLHRQEHICKIFDPATQMGFTFHLDPKFPYMAIFRPPWAQSISLEPYTCVTDAFNLSNEGDVGVRYLDKYSENTLGWTIAPYIGL